MLREEREREREKRCARERETEKERGSAGNRSAMTERSLARTLHLDEAEARLEGGELHLHDERVARHDGAAPFDVVDAGKEKVALAVRHRLLQADHAAHLRHRLHLQHAWHDRPGREVAVEAARARSERGSISGRSISLKFSV